MNWKVSNNKLVLEINFNTQSELANYLVKVARIADLNNHHPDFTITKCSFLKIELFHHESNCITKADYNLAGKISLIPLPKKEQRISSTWDL